MRRLDGAPKRPPRFTDRDCVECGQRYTPKSGRSETCGDVCRRNQSRRTKRESARRRRKENPEKCRARGRRAAAMYRDRHPEKIIERRRQFEAKYPQYSKEYYTRTRSRRLEYAREYQRGSKIRGLMLRHELEDTLKEMTK